MLRYAKGREPRALRSWRSTPDGAWSSLGASQTKQVRKALLRDQGGLCCYCQRRVAEGPDTMHVEHWSPQSTGQDTLRWRNLLGVCTGRSGSPTATHCDVARGNNALFLHPVEGEGPDPRDFVRYLGDGTASSEDPRAQADIDGALELNRPHLARGRAGTIDALRRLIERKGWSRGTLAGELQRLDALKPGEAWPVHVEVARYHLTRWLRRVAQDR